MRLNVALKPHYELLIEADALTHVGSKVTEQKIALISDQRVAELYATEVLALLAQAGKHVKLYTIPRGEGSKSLEVFADLLRRMVSDGFDRSSAVIALGGGITGDLAGYVAASYMRGIAFYQCPTSLLAMVDASIGGKTGINLPEGKNLVGAFWQPSAVFMDLKVLSTLGDGIFREGSAEVFKHGLLADEGILELVMRADYGPLAPLELLEEVVGRSAKVKVDIVNQDEREAGQRAYLNLGHTLAHALEAHSKHGLSHGHAVGYGLLFAGVVAAQRGWADETARLRDFVTWLQPAPLQVDRLEELMPYIKRDKKHHSGLSRWVLLEAIGQPRIVTDVTQAGLEEAWRTFKELL